MNSLSNFFKQSKQKHKRIYIHTYIIHLYPSLYIYIDTIYHKDKFTSSSSPTPSSRYTTHTILTPTKHQHRHFINTQDVMNTKSLIKPMSLSQKPSFTSQISTEPSNAKLLHVHPSSQKRIQLKISSQTKDFISSTPHISFFNRPLAQVPPMKNSSFSINYLTHLK